MVFSVIMAMLKIMKLEREEISVRRNTIAPEERLSSLKFVKSMASRIPSLIEKPPSVVNTRSAILAPEVSVEGEAIMTSVKISEVSIADTMPINPSASNRKEEVTELIKVGSPG